MLSPTLRGEVSVSRADEDKSTCHGTNLECRNGRAAVPCGGDPLALRVDDDTLVGMQGIPTSLSGPVLLEVVARGDARGFFLEAYRRDAFADLGIDHELVQTNHSRSRRGVVRGMHFQPGMGKLVRCLRGAIFDVVVDIRRGSRKFGQWEGFELDDVVHQELWCPDGFAHGFCVLSGVADVVYACTAYHDPATDFGFRYDD